MYFHGYPKQKMMLIGLFDFNKTLDSIMDQQARFLFFASNKSTVNDTDIGVLQHCVAEIRSYTDE